MTQRYGPDLLCRRRAGPAPPRGTGAAGRARTTAPVLLVGEAGRRQADAGPLDPLPGSESRTALRRPRLRPPAGRGAGGGALRRRTARPSGRFTSRSRRSCRATCNCACAELVATTAEDASAPAALPGRLRRRPGGGGSRRPAARRTVCVAGRADAAPAAAARAAGRPAGAGGPSAGALQRGGRSPRQGAVAATPGKWSATTPGRAICASCTPCCPPPAATPDGDRITAADLPASLRLLRRLEETPGRRAGTAAAARRPAGGGGAAADGTGDPPRQAATSTAPPDLLSIPRPRIWRRLKALGLIDTEADEGGEE